MTLEQIALALAPGLVAGLVAWGAIRVELRYMRRDVDRLRFMVHGPENEKNLVGLVANHDYRLGILERMK